MQAFRTPTIVVVEGELSLAAAGAAPLVIGPDAGAVIARGTAVRIQALSRVRFVSCATACDGPTNAGVTRLRADADFKPSTPPPAETLLAADLLYQLDELLVPGAAMQEGQ